MEGYAPRALPYEYRLYWEGVSGLKPRIFGRDHRCFVGAVPLCLELAFFYTAFWADSILQNQRKMHSVALEMPVIQCSSRWRCRSIFPSTSDCLRGTSRPWAGAFAVALPPVLLSIDLWPVASATSGFRHVPS